MGVRVQGFGGRGGGGLRAFWSNGQIITVAMGVYGSLYLGPERVPIKHLRANTHLLYRCIEPYRARVIGPKCQTL